MDPRERLRDPEEGLRAAVEGILTGLWTAIPVIVQDYNAALQTCSAQPTVQGVQRLPDGTTKSINMPKLVDCPVFFPRGGGFAITLPVAAGDEGLAVFSSRCIDAWWQSGGIQPQAELRMHDLSDGFVFVGFSSKPNALTSVSTTSLQVRSTDGQTYIDLSSGKIQLVANEVIIHGRNKTTFDAGGTGFVYQSTQIDTYTDGVSSNHHYPTPPEVPV